MCAANVLHCPRLQHERLSAVSDSATPGEMIQIQPIHFQLVAKANGRNWESKIIKVLVRILTNVTRLRNNNDG